MVDKWLLGYKGITSFGRNTILDDQVTTKGLIANK